MSEEIPGNLKDFLSTPEVTEFYDTSIESKDGKKHFVARVIVAAHSKVLFKMFSKEKDKNDFQLPTVPGEILEIILSWMESGELLLSWRNVLEVLQSAEFLDVPGITSLCQEWMIARISTKNAVGIWMFARDNFLQGLEKTSLSFIGSKFTRIYREEEFSVLELDSLKVLLNSDELSCGEEKVWEGLKVWLTNNNEKDMVDITSILETIRFGLLENNFVYDQVRPALESLFPSFSFSFIWKTSALPRFPESLLFSFGGRSDTGRLSTISVMDPAAAKWTDLSISLPSNMEYEALVVNTDIFLMGSDLSDLGDPPVFMKFNPNTMEMSSLSKMKEDRDFFSFAILNDNIYVMGGEDDVGILRSVERYSLNRNQWYKMGPMNEMRCFAGAATLNENIYVVGGVTADSTRTASVEMFSPVTGMWSYIKPMRVARAGMKVVAMDSKLYVVGGMGYGIERLRSGEVYDPETQEWTDLPETSIPRHLHSLVVVQGKLLVLGGGTNDLQNTNMVEQLNLLNNTWEKVEDMPCERSSFGSCVISFNKLNEKARNALRWKKSEMSVDEVRME